MEDTRKPADAVPTSRKPYEAPRVVEDAPLEHMSLACSKFGSACSGMGGGTNKT